MARPRTPANYDQARDFFQKALALVEPLAADPDSQDLLAHTLHHLGTLERDYRHPDLAEPAYARATAIRERLARDHADVPDFRYKLAELLLGRSELYLGTGRLGDAKPVLDQGLELAERLANDFPGVPLYEKVLGGLDYNAACWYAHSSAGPMTGSPPDSRGTAAEQGAVRAVEYLRKARQAGFFNDPKMVDTVITDTDLAPLRSRPDFQRLIAELNQRPAKPE
jgi:hypothetical protein